MGLTGRCKERERKRTIRSFVLRSYKSCIWMVMLTTYLVHPCLRSHEQY
ncbi:hypothetical protein CIPAW_01G072600 [Carya illinoinensis]|uniref:Uncharacterized protein n=1 Tax=Carya illinoinensis TaxID=32201 RepID=A0A8T1RLR9_CARIL|nr:hypothetical protein CIPAW_01G072600 [Carya illinoinensis]